MTGSGFGKGPLSNAGYDREALYFHERDKELIRKCEKPKLRVIDGGGQAVKAHNRPHAEKKAA
jgi:hypothetical protein